jgi:hypothetical protein
MRNRHTMLYHLSTLRTTPKTVINEVEPCFFAWIESTHRVSIRRTCSFTTRSDCLLNLVIYPRSLQTKRFSSGSLHSSLAFGLLLIGSNSTVYEFLWSEISPIFTYMFNATLISRGRLTALGHQRCTTNCRSWTLMLIMRRHPMDHVYCADTAFPPMKHPLANQCLVIRRFSAATFPPSRPSGLGGRSLSSSRSFERGWPISRLLGPPSPSLACA